MIRILVYESEKIHNRKDLSLKLMNLTNPDPLDSPMQRFLELKKKGFVIIAWEKGEPIGWCSLFSCSRHYFTTDVFVAEQHRNQKIATRMLNKVLDKKLQVRPWDEAGRNLYAKFKNTTK